MSADATPARGADLPRVAPGAEAVGRAIEEASLNALQTQAQLFYDGWLLRLSPGKAKRARSVNPHFGSTLPLAAKIAHCEALYAQRGLPALFRITPFAHPHDLDGALARCGYLAFDRVLVQTVALAQPPEPRARPRIELTAPPLADFVAVAGLLRGSSPVQQAAHLERLSGTPLDVRALVASIDGRPVACGQAARERDLVGIYDMVTAEGFGGRGLATQIVAELLAWAWNHGATRAYLQVSEDNPAALAVYGKYGFATAYAYHYRARPGEFR